MRKLIGALLATAIALPILAAPVLAVETNCESNEDRQTAMEATTSSPSQSRSGVSATLNISNADFDICNNYILRAGPSASVLVQPKFPGGANPGAQVLQLGIIECGGGLYASFCQGENNPHFVAAYGECTQGIGIIVDLGPADYNNHTFAIYLNTDQKWHFNIDGGAEEFFIPDDPYVSCWTGGSRKAVWLFERWNPGDSVGNPGTSERSLFTDMRFGVYGQGWFNSNFYGGATVSDCHKRAADDNCQVYDYDNFWAYTHS